MQSLFCKSTMMMNGADGGRDYIHNYLIFTPPHGLRGSYGFCVGGVEEGYGLFWSCKEAGA